MSTKTPIADLIKQCRKNCNITQEKLSELSGISLSTIKKYESGVRNPKQDQLFKIAKALGVPPTTFLSSYEIETVGDVISILTALSQQTDMHIHCKKDKNGKYLLDTLSLSFSDMNINEALANYLTEYHNAKHANSENEKNSSVSYVGSIDDVTFHIDTVGPRDTFNTFNEYLKKTQTRFKSKS